MCMQNDESLISAATSCITAERVFNNNSKNPIKNFKLLCIYASLRHTVTVWFLRQCVCIGSANGLLALFKKSIPDWINTSYSKWEGTVLFCLFFFGLFFFSPGVP